MVESLTDVSQRPGVFWAGLALLLGGGLLSEGIAVAGTPLGPLLLGLGAVLLGVRLLVAGYRIGRRTLQHGRDGYDQARED